MKRFTLFFMALMACIMASAQSGLPDFSTEDSPIYYPVKFKTGGNYLADKGAGNKMQTVASESDATNFQLIGHTGQLYYEKQIRQLRGLLRCTFHHDDQSQCRKDGHYQWFCQ